MALPMVIPPLLQIKMSIAKYNAQEKIENGYLQTISLEKKGIVWADPGKEILIDGELFDIKEIREITTTITVTGIFDKEETSLQKLAENITGKEKKEQGILLTEYFKFLSNNYYQNEHTGLNAPVPELIIYSNENVFFHKDSFIKIPLPPPKI